MKLFTKKISNCMICSNRKVREKRTQDMWIQSHICSLNDKLIEEVDIHSMNEERIKEVKIYGEWFPDWCPLEECE